MPVKDIVKVLHWLRCVHQEAEEDIENGTIKGSKELGDDCFNCLDDKLTCLEELIKLLESGKVKY